MSAAFFAPKGTAFLAFTHRTAANDHFFGGPQAGAEMPAPAMPAAAGDMTPKAPAINWWWENPAPEKPAPQKAAGSFWDWLAK